MIPNGRSFMFYALALAAMGAAGRAAERPPSDEEEARRQQRQIDRLAAEQRRMDIYNRRHQRRTGTSLLDKARRAKARP